MGIGGIQTGVRDIAKYLNKKKIDKQNIFLVYGENEGLKNELVEILKKIPPPVYSIE